jgi:hypothetical protein
VDAIGQLVALGPAARTHLGQNGRAYLQSHFEKQAVIDEYERVLSDLAATRSSLRQEAAGRA